MNISVILNAHNDSELVLDSLDAIRTYVSDQIEVVIDGARWEWGSKLALPAYKTRGFIHAAAKSPYKNIVLGLMIAAERWDSDWYCYCEPDVLFTSDAFKTDLQAAADQGIWAIGNDHRVRDVTFPLIEHMLKLEFRCSRYLLGCCVFYKRELIKKLQEIDFFEKFLHLTSPFYNGFFPGFREQGGYDIAEHIFPTLAYQFGGKVAQFADWDSVTETWSGYYEKYPMRWQPDIEEFFPNATIIHPLKDYDSPLRNYYREVRDTYS